MVKTPTTEQLRARIDSGSTGEKVGFPDPAAAPLGTDDEAAGNSPTVAERRMESQAHPQFRPSRAISGPWIYFGIIVLIAASLLLVKAYA